MRRREFLRTSTVAVGVSLLEGCRRQEEQFLVQPPTRPAGVLQGQSVWRPSVCQQCAAGCGMLVRVVDGNAKKVEGLEAHPVNRGGMCALGHSSLQELYNPDRILAPQRLSGARGGGVYESVTWEDGLAQVLAAVNAGAPDGLAFVGGEDSRGMTAALLRRLAFELGAPPPTFLEPPELEVERRAAALALGVDDVPYFDVARAEYVLSIGAPMLDRWRSPAHYTRAYADMRRARPSRRGRFAHAEPRMSLTAANADVWLPIRPGTEGVLARGIAGLLIAEGAVGADAQAAYAGLFPGAPPTLEATAAACDVNPDRIRTVARDLAAAESRVVVAGGSAAAHSNGLFNVTAALGLNVLLGNLGQPGGVYAPSRVDLAASVAPADGGTTSPAELAARLRGESGPPVRALIVLESDPVHALPAGWGVEAALANVQTIVVLSSFTDDTTLHADLVLPVHTEFERFNAVEPAAAVGARAISIAQPAVEPMGDAFHPADVLLAIAVSVGGTVSAAFPWASLEALTRARLGELQAGLPGGVGTDAATYYFDALARGGVFEEGVTALAPPGPAGTAPEATESRPDGDASYPFALLPHESLKMAAGRGANRPWLQEMPDPLSTVMWQSWAELAPGDAAELGVADGDRIRIESAVGAVEVAAVIDPTVRPGLVGMPLGDGHRDYGRYARQRGANPMHLVGGLLVDGTTASAWAATRVRITRIGAGPLARFGRSYETHGAEEEIPVGWAPQDTSRGRLA